MRSSAAALTLRDLEARFLKHEDERTFNRQDSIDGADGIIFLCPVCFRKNDGRIGTHSVICWAPSVPQTTSPVPGRWNLVGTSLDDLTLKAGSSSVLLKGGCNAHFFVRDGKIVNA